MSANARGALTLVEVMITTVVLVGALTLSMEVLSNTKLQETNAAAKDEIARESMLIMRSIADDLTFSGWYLPTSEDIDQDNVLTASEDINGNGLIDAIAFASNSQAADRSAWYYPYIQVQDSTGTQTSGLGSRFTITQRPAIAVALNLPTTLPGGDSDAGSALSEPAWSTSFKARSQEIVFLRAITGSYDGGAESYDIDADDADRAIRVRSAAYASAARSGAGGRLLNFSGVDGKLKREDWQSAGDTAGIHDKLGVLHASGWEPVMSGSTVTGYTERNADSMPYGAILDAGWYDVNAAGTDEDLPVKVQWDTVETPTMTKADWYQEKLREYTYAVVPCPSPTGLGRESPLGLGRLVRAHKVRVTSLPASVTEGVEIGQLLPVRQADATSANYRMRIDRVLSDNVVRIVFDTFRTVDVGASEVTTLSPNQIRVRLYMARRQTMNRDVVISRISESIIGMRSRSSSADVSAIQSTLGTTPLGVPH